MFYTFATQEMFGTFDTQEIFDTVDTDIKHIGLCTATRQCTPWSLVYHDAPVYAPAACGAKRSPTFPGKMGSMNNFEVGARRSHEKIGSKSLKLFMSMYYLYLSRFTPIT